MPAIHAKSCPCDTCWGRFLDAFVASLRAPAPARAPRRAASSSTTPTIRAVQSARMRLSGRLAAIRSRAGRAPVLTPADLAALELVLGGAA